MGERAAICSTNDKNHGFLTHINISSGVPEMGGFFIQNTMELEKVPAPTAGM